MTKVIFRKVTEDWCKGDIVAFFPDTYKNGELMSYSHYGQHGMATWGFYAANTKPAKPEEYADLYSELVNLVGYDDLVIRQRLTR